MTTRREPSGLFRVVGVGHGLSLGAYLDVKPGTYTNVCMRMDSLTPEVIRNLERDGVIERVILERDRPHLELI